ncbi:MAG: DsbA family oxidoreductase [Microthrixaceae bacterium]
MRIDIWSDVICPWCYLGSRRLAAALDRLGADGTLPRGEVDLHWRAFELDPGAPAEPSDLRTALERKYGPGSFDGMTARLTALGAPEGIDYRFDLAQRVNTFDAHRLIGWAAGQEAGQGPLVERLFLAYFTEGADVSDAGTLTRLAAEAGLDAELAAEVVAGGGFADEVRADEASARELEITGVPAFVVDGRVMIPGAQEVDTIVRVLTRALERGPVA